MLSYFTLITVAQLKENFNTFNHILTLCHPHMVTLYADYSVILNIYFFLS